MRMRLRCTCGGPPHSQTALCTPQVQVQLAAVIKRHQAPVEAAQQLHMCVEGMQAAYCSCGDRRDAAQLARSWHAPLMR